MPQPTDEGAPRAHGPVIDALSCLWVSGVAAAAVLALLPVVPGLSRSSPRAGAWVLYLSFGAILLTTTLGSMVASTRRHVPQGLLLAFGALPVVVAAAAAGLRGTPIALGLAILQTACIAAMAPERAHLRWSRLAMLAILGFISWTAVLEMFFWEPMRTVSRPSTGLFVVGSLGVVAACQWAFGTPATASGRRRLWLRAADCAAIVLLLLLALRTDGLFITDRLGADGTFYHWGVLVAPAEAVRQGGWLLWDVSSPYGFLITLAIAAFPAPTAWQSLYLLNAAASGLLAIWLYRTMRAARRTAVGTLFAFVVAVAAVFLASTYPPTLTPEHYFPQSGAFRYGWCYALVGLLLLERSLTPDRVRQHLVLVAGSACWVLSMFWSPDIAVVASLIWYPAFALIVFRDRGILGGERRWTSALTWLVAPVLVLGAAVATLVAIYRAGLGHGPDLSAYVELARSFAGARVGEVATVLARPGMPPSVVPVAFGCLLLATAAAALARRAAGHRDLPLAIGLTAGVWGLLSYPVGEPFVFAFCRLMPFLVLALGLVLNTAARDRDGSEPWVTFVRVGAVSLLVGVLVSAYANVPELQYYVSAIRHERWLARDVAAGLPHVDLDLEDLLRGAGVSAHDRLFYAGGAYGDMMPQWTPSGTQTPVRVSRQWLAGPVSTMVFRSDDRKRTVIARAIARQQEGGWLIERQDRRGIVYAIDSAFFDEVNAAFVPTRVVESEKWRLVRYEPVAGGTGDDFAWNRGRVPDGSPDLRVESASIDASVTRIWGYFGHEWSTTRPWRCADGVGSVHLFTPSARAARLVVELPSDEAEASVSVRVNRGGRIVPGNSSHVGANVAISLAAGWNTIALERTTPDGSAFDANAPSNACTTDPAARSAIRIGTIHVE